ncbi:hypothetical protein [uncultured Nocardioides sp.]|uniref:hypothetical protein n=1 Tax=uncultured Nocardioides sp. TaxID=198441 RepID=UPI002622D6A6|nr:hypothetical protein [uncultured Nocardioides sp.]HRD59499.1 hypothetical protein [Nocardioides sp.]
MTDPLTDAAASGRPPSPLGAEPAAGGLDSPQLRRVVAVLCVTEITSWGVLFYAFTVLSTTIRDSEGWSLTWLVASFTAAQVVAAATGL